MAGFIAFLMGNFTLTFLFLSIISSSVSLFIKRKHLNKSMAIEVLFRHFLFFNIGLAYLYNGVFHVFFGKLAAYYIGWAQSPFQAEVGFASFGIGVVGVMAPWRDFSFRIPAIIMPACFLLGAAGGHVYQMIKFHNYAPGNAGVIFWTDLLIPALGFLLLYLQKKNPYRISN